MEKKSTLHTIYVLTKVGKIVSMVVFVGSIIGGCGAIIAILSLALGLNTAVQFGETTISSLLADNTGLTTNDLYTAMAVAIISTLATGIMAWFSKRYFEQQMKLLTPFTFAGAQATWRLGIIIVVTAIVASAVAGLTVLIMNTFLPCEWYETGNWEISIIIGVALMIISVICKYGAEKENLVELPTDFNSDQIEHH